MNARQSIEFVDRHEPLAKQGVPHHSQLHAHGVGVRLGQRELLQATTAQFAAGQVTVVLGPNGAGKSTLMSTLTGQRQPHCGHVALAGQPLSACAPEALARCRAFVAQESQVAFDFSVQEVVELGRYPHRKHPAPDEADIPCLAMQATAVEHLAGRALNTLSGGEKARVHLARALAQIWECAGEGGGRWLLLDEPTAALDLQHQHRVLQLAQRWARVHGVGVVAVLHDLNLALRYSDRCLVLAQGALVASGATREVLTPQCIQDVWQVRAVPVLLPSLGRGGQAAVRQYVFDADDSSYPLG